MSQYISIKDDTTKQVIKPKTWTLVHFTMRGVKQDVVTPAENAVASWAWYLNVATPNGATMLKARFSRDPKKLNDFTGQTYIDLTRSTISSHTWFFKARKGQSVGVMVWHNGTKPLTLGTREIKLWIA
jgi:hypothetical protein